MKVGGRSCRLPLADATCRKTTALFQLRECTTRMHRARLDQIHGRAIHPKLAGRPKTTEFVEVVAPRSTHSCAPTSAFMPTLRRLQLRNAGF